MKRLVANAVEEVIHWVDCDPSNYIVIASAEKDPGKILLVKRIGEVVKADGSIEQEWAAISLLGSTHMTEDFTRYKSLKDVIKYYLDNPNYVLHEFRSLNEIVDFYSNIL